jgi:hypothetical protein
VTQGLQPFALVAAGLVVMVFAASCGGGDDADGSEGFERFEEDGLAVEYPSSWNMEEGGEGGEGGAVISVHPERDENGLFPRLSVNRQDREFRGAPQAGGVMATERPFQLNEGRLVSDREAEVRGSEGAWRVDLRFEIRLDGGGTVPGRAVELIALKGDEQVLLTLAGPAETMERLPVERIVGSLDLS